MQARALGHPRIDEGSGLVKAPTGSCGEPLGEANALGPRHVETGHPLEAGAAIDPDIAAGIDQDVGHRGIADERLQRPQTAHLIVQRTDQRQEFVGAQHDPLGTQGVGDRRGAQ